MWKPIKEFEGLYEISSEGQIASLPRDYKYGRVAERTILKTDIARGYKRVTLFKNGKRHRRQVHVLVAEAFIDNPDGKPIVNHIDENKLNNRAENLMWCTYKENSNWGTSPQRIGEKNSKPVSQYTKGGVFVKTWSSMTEAAEALGICLSCVSVAVNSHSRSAGNYKWRYADERY